MKPSALLVTTSSRFPGFLYIAWALAPATWGAMHLAGVGLLFAGLSLVTLARIQLGNVFSVTPQATMLVTRGLYARIRNPIYVFSTIAFAGLFLYMDWPLFLVALIPVAVMQFVRARQESKALEARFGDEYRAYKARTWF